MGNYLLRLISIFVLSFFVLGASASPIGDQFQLRTENFPANSAFQDLTFNSFGDFGQETIFGSLVSEQFVSGVTEQAIFRFQFTTQVLDPFAKFGVVIAGLDFNDGLIRELASVVMAADFGVANMPLTNITSGATAFYNNQSLWLAVQSPFTWDQLFRAVAPNAPPPTRMFVDFGFNLNNTGRVQNVSEPSTAAALLLGGLMLWNNRRRYRKDCANN